MTRLHMVLLILMCIGANVLHSVAETLLATEGDLVTLPCSLSGTYTYPVWRGPPSLSRYTFEGSADINSALNASARLSYASNKQDLLLASAVVADSGEYKCSSTGIGENTFNLNVSEKTSTKTTTVSDCECKSLNCNISLAGCICLWILIGAVIVCVISTVVLLILRFVIGVRFPCGILNCENKKTSPKDSKTGKTKSTAGNGQPPKDEVNQDLVMEDKKETRVDFDKRSADHTKKSTDLD